MLGLFLCTSCAIFRRAASARKRANAIGSGLAGCVSMPASRSSRAALTQLNRVWSVTPGAASTAAMLCPAFTSPAQRGFRAESCPGRRRHPKASGCRVPMIASRRFGATRRPVLANRPDGMRAWMAPCLRYLIGCRCCSSAQWLQHKAPGQDLCYKLRNPGCANRGCPVVVVPGTATPRLHHIQEPGTCLAVMFWRRRSTKLQNRLRVAHLIGRTLQAR